MKTYPTQHITSYNIALANLIASKLGRVDKIRVAQVGAGVVILPDTNRTQDLSENEMRKALHIEDANEQKLTKYSIKSCEDDSTFFILLTQKQIDLLNWLIEHKYIDTNSVESNPMVKFTII